MKNTKRRTSRRAFLQQTGGLLAGAGMGVSAPMFIPRHVLGAGSEPAPSDRVLIGCIGVGNKGRENMGKNLKDTIAVCEVDATRMVEAKDRAEKANSKPCAAYDDYRRLLDNKDIDAVIVVVPDHWHCLITTDACSAGKDVYCEKPLSLTIAEGQAMVKAARDHKRIVQTGSQQRSDARFRLACELVRSGRLGKINTVKIGIPKVNFPEPAVPDCDPPKELAYDFWLGPAPLKPYNPKHVHYNFRFFWDYSGGQMTNFGAHDLDIAQWGLGMDDSGPVSIAAEARFQKDHWYEVPEWCKVTYEYANGVKVICEQLQPGGATFEGEKGSIHVDRQKIISDPPELVKQPLLESDVHLYTSDNHFGNWLKCIKTRELPIADVAIGHRSATVCHLGNIAIRTGRKIVWDPAKEQIVGDIDAAEMLRRPYRSPWKMPTA
jgi:predicted dehydrogenase